MVCWLGLFRAEEILASSLLAAMPAELVKPAYSTHESEQVTMLLTSICKLHTRQ